MGNRVAVVTEETSSVNATEIFEQYCYETGIPYVGCEDCRKQLDFTIDTYFYEAGGKLLYKNKLINDNGQDVYCLPTENDVEWYVYGSASDGRVATVYPRFKIQDNNELYKNHFEDSPPNPAVAYNTEMVSNTFTAVAESAGITGIETHRHLGEKRYEIKDHLGNVRAVVSDIKNADDYADDIDDWKFLADVRSLSNYYPYGSLISAGSWSGSSYNYGYNGMLKEAIGDDIYNTHFRNLSGEDGRWWSPDPMSGKYPNKSPYISMNNNPIRRIDPNGDDDYEVDKKGYITLLNENENKNDILFAKKVENKFDISNYLKIDKGIFLEVKKGILDNKETRDVRFSDKKNHKYEMLKVDNGENAQSIFQFLAENTKVEWGWLSTEDNNKNKLDYITTSHDTDREAGIKDIIQYDLTNKNEIFRHTHSHPDNNPYPSGLLGSRVFSKMKGDMYNIKFINIYKNSKKATFYIYTPDRGLYFKYDGNMTKKEFIELNK